MEIRTCVAGSCSGWFSSGWSLYRSHWLTWSGMVMVFVLLGIALSLIPVIGDLAFQFLQPLLLGGFFVAAERAHNGTAPAVMDIFAGQTSARVRKSLYGLGAFSVATTFLSVIIATGSAFGSVADLQGSSGFNIGAGFWIGVLLSLMVTCLTYTAMWYAIPLAALGERGPLESLKLGFTATFLNFIPLLVFGILTGILVALGLLAFLIGICVTAPIAILAQYYSYKNIFFRSVAS